MSSIAVCLRTRSTRRSAMAGFFLALAVALVVTPAAALAQDDDAAKILKAMSDYMANEIYLPFL